MNITERTISILQSWGASPQQIQNVVDSGNLELQREHISGIEECLQMLYPDSSRKMSFLKQPSKSVFFDGKKPLDVICSGDEAMLSEAHYIIRSMLCV
ncbi:hypothetical protein J4N45_26605 [Vibrio sp. SCSIO 43140]|uniref:hypothetical protein n=1 Tax=Vibrio sp. SCSIO 43140 TaxID=2819100 RepID=UPI002074D420|nr:hypothetical protein [Vibrio sp. SCSIO 43140]USD62924.1 hypothetical protein J4N45_26605 [Vibrio sp. SCSIO 43140]